jgi:hypothetical protein
MSLYQLIGSTSLQPGNLVDMGNGGHRYGKIVSVIKKDYKLPNPCMVTGAIKFFKQEVNLYLIRGLDEKPIRPPDGYAWGWTA